MNEPDPTATFRLDQEAAATETEFWEAIRHREAETTLTQREALTRRVDAQAGALSALGAILWTTLVLGYLVFLVLAVQHVIGWFR